MYWTGGTLGQGTLTSACDYAAVLQVPGQLNELASVEDNSGGAACHSHFGSETFSSPASVQTDPARCLISRSKSATAPGYWFVMEFGNATSFHLNAAVLAPPGVKGDEIVKSAIRRTGGAWNGAGGHKQVTKSSDDPCWWAFYSLKQTNPIVRETDRKLLASPAGLRRTARTGTNSGKSCRNRLGVPRHSAYQPLTQKQTFPLTA